MFTGLVEGVCPVTAIRATAGRRQITIDLGRLAEGLSPGASVAISGACLTVETLEGSRIRFAAVPETLSRTSLGTLQPGARVNVERALHIGDRLAGHLVQGHVDGQGKVIDVGRRGGEWLLSVEGAEGLGRQMIPKGSVAIDGVSLTISERRDERFSVALVPFTLEHTTLGERRPGDTVNVELDLIGKYVRQALEDRLPQGSLTIEKLREQGFLDS